MRKGAGVSSTLDPNKITLLTCPFCKSSPLKFTGLDEFCLHVRMCHHRIPLTSLDKVTFRYGIRKWFRCPDCKAPFLDKTRYDNHHQLGCSNNKNVYALAEQRKQNAIEKEAETLEKTKTVDLITQLESAASIPDEISEISRTFVDTTADTALTLEALEWTGANDFHAAIGSPESMEYVTQSPAEFGEVFGPSMDKVMNTDVISGQSVSVEDFSVQSWGVSPEEVGSEVSQPDSCMCSDQEVGKQRKDEKLKCPACPTNIGVLYAAYKGYKEHVVHRHKGVNTQILDRVPGNAAGTKWVLCPAPCGHPCVGSVGLKLHQRLCKLAKALANPTFE